MVPSLALSLQQKYVSLILAVSFAVVVIILLEWARVLSFVLFSAELLSKLSFMVYCSTLFVDRICYVCSRCIWRDLMRMYVGCSWFQLLARIEIFWDFWIELAVTMRYGLILSPLICNFTVWWILIHEIISHGWMQSTHVGMAWLVLSCWRFWLLIFILVCGKLGSLILLELLQNLQIVWISDWRLVHLLLWVSQFLL